MKPPVLKVTQSGLVQLRAINDFPDGQLVIGEVGQQLPFPIKRVYYINNLFNAHAQRGRHAHKQLEQIIFCVQGKFRLGLDDGHTRQTITMQDPTWGIRLGPKLWHVMDKFSSDCVILVLASALYRETDYIRSYNEFLEFIR